MQPIEIIKDRRGLRMAWMSPSQAIIWAIGYWSYYYYKAWIKSLAG